MRNMLCGKIININSFVTTKKHSSEAVIMEILHVLPGEGKGNRRDKREQVGRRED